MSTFVQRLAAGLGLGRLPGVVRSQLKSDGGILYLTEGVLQTAILRDYRAPGVRSNYRRISFIGYFALSQCRMVAKARCYHQVNINVAYDDAAFKKMTFAVRPSYLSLVFDASAQSPEASGQVEVRLHLPDLAAAIQILEQRGAQVMRNGR